MSTRFAALLLMPLIGGIVQAQELTQQATQGTRTVLDGVYTEAQAERGQEAYEQYCSERCHGRDLNGGNPPPLHTSMFLDVWREDYLETLYEFIATRMPKDQDIEEGSLPEQDYVDILAYILAFNEFPAGPNELTRADMPSTLLIGLNGPEPLPPSAMVRVVGCFDGGGEDWNLSAATLPARVRVVDETDAAELEKSAASRPGELSFRLTNLDLDHSPDELAALRARRMQVKGVMNGSGTSARIYVLSFEQVGPSCN